MKSLDKEIGRWLGSRRAWSYCSECYICEKTKPKFLNSHTNRHGDVILDEAVPKGWRSARRGFAGHVLICDDCNISGRNYRTELHTKPNYWE